MSRKNIGYFLIFTALFLIFINIGISLNRWSQYKQAFDTTCEMVREKIYLPEKQVIPWYHHCKKAASDLPYRTQIENLLYRIRQVLASLEVSHLYLNDPVEDKLMWSGLQKETGIRVRNINEQYFVIDVKKNSPADRAQINFGDRVVDINGEREVDYSKIQFSEGDFKFARGQKSFVVHLTPEEIKVDGPPELKKIDPNMAMLKISSFRAEYFKDEEWQSLVKGFAPYKSIIVDLRDNLGGNFVSMLRALSPFFCGKEYLGNLGDEEPKVKGLPLENDLSDEVQYKLMKENSRLALESYEGYGCYKGPIFVFMNANTGSVAEIFAQIVRQKNRGKLIGTTTSGQVLLAVWYTMPLLGTGYTLSIPEANFFDLNEESFEGYGIDPDFTVDYFESDIKEAKDSFVEEIYFQKLHTSKK